MQKKLAVPQHNEAWLREIGVREEQLSGAAGRVGRAFAGFWLDVNALGGVSREELDAFRGQLSALRAVLDRCEAFVLGDLPHFPHRWLEAEVGGDVYCKRHFCACYGSDLWYRLASDYTEGKHVTQQINYWYHGEEVAARLVGHDQERPRCAVCGEEQASR